MRNFQFSFPLTVLLFLLFSSCSKDEIVEQANFFPNVAPELQTYFEEFEYQGALRSIQINLADANIIGKIEELGEEHVAGQCTYGAAIDNEITIDKGFWNDFPQLLVREMVVFHELGHCYLDRGHTEGAKSNGACISIMRSGLGDCFDNYNSATRVAYLDELFSNL